MRDCIKSLDKFFNCASKMALAVSEGHLIWFEQNSLQFATSERRDADKACACQNEAEWFGHRLRIGVRIRDTRDRRRTICFTGYNHVFASPEVSRAREIHYTGQDRRRVDHIRLVEVPHWTCVERSRKADC